MKKHTFILLATAMQFVSVAAHAESATVKIDGSSSVFPITEAVAEEFQKSKKGAVRATVGISGTGGGFKKFCRGETDVSNASRPILTEEIKLCAENNVEYVELPVAFDALTVAVSPKNTFVDCITVTELKTIWSPDAQGKITHWNQVRADWPNEKINLYGAGSDSGTFDYFTEAVNGKAKASRGDYTGSEDDNVLVQGISNDKYALGYIPYSYYSGNTKSLKALAIDGGKGCVMPSAENAKNATYNPLSRPLFIYVSVKSSERPEIKEFVQFYLANASKLATEVHYLALPDSAYKMAQTRFDSKHKGSVFGGTPEIGVAVEELLKRETSQSSPAR
jgi:phosphate transport system substrate-binding protein